MKVKQLKQKRKRSQLKEFPYIIKKQTRVSLALKFFLDKTTNKSEIKTHQKLLTDLVATATKSGANITKRKSLYEYAFTKKKYFYYRWF